MSMMTLKAFLGAALLSVLTAAADTESLCGQYQNRTAVDGLYTVFTNQWGADGSGTQCVQLNERNSSVDFTATWKWQNNSTSVHAYPNVGFNSPLLPVQLSNLSRLSLKASWGYDDTRKSDKVRDVDVGGLKKANASTDVALDMFLDPDPTRANSTTLPKYEIMIWLGRYGLVKPIGYHEGSNVTKHKLGGTTFSLYDGPNNNGQHVYAWLASKNITKFDGDVSPLVHYIWRHGYISPNNYLGVVQFGTEALHTNGKEVTFDAQKVSMDLVRGMPRPDSSGAAVAVQWTRVFGVAMAAVAVGAMVL